jgi:hypothetical protein
MLSIVKERIDLLVRQRGPHFELLSWLCCRSYVCGSLGLLAGKQLGEPRFNIVHAPAVDGEPFYYCFLKMSRDVDWVMSDKVPSTDNNSVFVIEQLVNQ